MRTFRFNQQTAYQPGATNALMGSPMPNILEAGGELSDTLSRIDAKIKAADRNAQFQDLQTNWIAKQAEVFGQAEAGEIGWDEVDKQLKKYRQDAIKNVTDKEVLQNINPILNRNLIEAQTKIRDAQRKQVVTNGVVSLNSFLDATSNDYIPESPEGRTKIRAVQKAMFNRNLETGIIDPVKGQEFFENFLRSQEWNAFQADLQTSPEYAKQLLADGAYTLDEDQKTKAQELINVAIDQKKNLAVNQYLNESLFTPLADDPKNRPSRDYILQQQKDEVLSPGESRMFLRRIDMLEEADQKQEEIGLAVSSMDPIDYKDADQKKYANIQADIFSQQLIAQNTTSKNQYMALISLAGKRNFISDQLKGRIRIANRLEDPQETRDALFAFREIRDQTVLMGQFEDSDMNNLIPLMMRVDAGEMTVDPITGQDNFQTVMEETKRGLQMTPEELKSRSLFVNLPYNYLEFSNQAESMSMTGFGMSIDKTLYPDLKGKIINDAMNYYKFNHYTVREALYKSIQVAKNTWMQTEYGSRGRLMENPPEKFMPDYDPLLGNEEIRKLIDEIPEFKGKNFMLVSDTLTTDRTPPSWMIKIDEDEDGIYEQWLYDGRVPKRWYAPTNKTEFQSVVDGLKEVGPAIDVGLEREKRKKAMISPILRPSFGYGFMNKFGK